MRISETKGGDFVEDRYPAMKLIREWRDCKIWSAGIEDHLLLLVDTTTKQVAVFDYETSEQREHDIQFVQSLRDDGGAGSGIFARLRPAPPSLTDHNAREIPRDSEND